MEIGAPFNPYKLFRGVFAPYWLLEHRGIGAGAKLCYIRLIGFAGKDGRCYPSLDRLGTSLGVSERQARDYVKELERAGLIVIEQRGLRKTNVYLFVWTAEMETLSNSISEDPVTPWNAPCATPPPTPADRNTCSGQDRNSTSAPDRNSSSGQDRNRASAPIGIESAGIGSWESSSSSSAILLQREWRMTMTSPDQAPPADMAAACQSADPAEIILQWARDRGVQRLRSDRRIGLPDEERVAEWSAILKGRGADTRAEVFAVLDAAYARADRTGEWRNWAFLTLQVQLAAEKRSTHESRSSAPTNHTRIGDEDPASEWAHAKAKIRTQVSDISFSNWFDCTRQLQRNGDELLIAVPDEPTRTFLGTDYGELISRVLASLGIRRFHFDVLGSTEGELSRS